jgi:hypothetical protein
VNESEEEYGMKKAYEKPAIVHTEKIEARAVSCAPAPPGKDNSMTCPQGPISS